jgi:hypothetical protein
LISQKLELVGNGIAAAVAGACLAQMSVKVIGASNDRDTSIVSHYIILNRPTFEMLNGILSREDFEILRHKGKVLSHRIVSWDGLKSVRLQFPSFIIDSIDLISIISSDLIVEMDAPIGAKLYARGRSFNDGQRVGNCYAYQWTNLPVPMRSISTMYTVAVEGGWAMIAPKPSGGFVLQVITPFEDYNLALEVATKCLAKVFKRPLSSSDFPRGGGKQCSPQYANTKLVDRLSIGDEHMALDPLSGDGVGAIIRLSCLVSALARDGLLNKYDLLEQVETRLMRFYLAHINSCMNYYKSIVFSEVWLSHVSALEREKFRLRAILKMASEEKYKLSLSDKGFRIHAF